MFYKDTDRFVGSLGFLFCYIILFLIALFCVGVLENAKVQVLA